MVKASRQLWREEIWDDEVYDLDKLTQLRRAKNPVFKIENRLFVNSVFSDNAVVEPREAGSKLMVDEIFKIACADVLNFIDNERLRQGVEIYSDDQKIILIHELYRCRSRYKDFKPRGDGSDTFYSHILGALRIMVQAEGITGLSSVLAIINHDVIEDFVDKHEIEDVRNGVRDDISRYFEILTNNGEEDFEDLVTEAKGLEEKLPKGVVSKMRRFARVPADFMDKPVDEIMAACIGKLVPIDADYISRLSYVNKSSTNIAEIQRERMEDELEEDLVDYAFYSDQIPGFDIEIAMQIIKEVRLICRGVTKIRRAKEADTINATLIKTLETIKTIVRTALVKLADRRHNSSTFDGHKKPDGEPDMEKILHKVTETEQIYLPIARLLHVRNIIRDLVADCFKYKNPDVKHRFEELSKERVSQWGSTRLDPGKKLAPGEVRPNCREVLENRLSQLKRRVRKKHGNVVDFKIVPRTLDFYSSQVDKPIADMEFDDLKISDADYMFEIVVLTKPGTEDDKDEDSRRKAMADVLDEVETLFGREEGADSANSMPWDHDPDRYFGLTPIINSPSLGGNLFFRINDETFEARSKRGLLADFSAGTPEHVSGLISDVLNRIKGVRDVLRVVNEELFRPPVRVLTKDDEVREFPFGSTALDFAAGVHSRLLVGLNKVYVMEKQGRRPVRLVQREVDPLAPLEPGKRYFVKSSISDEHSGDDKIGLVGDKLILIRNLEGGKDERAEIKVDPGMSNFCGSNARTELKRFFHSLPGDSTLGYECSRVVGQRYFDRLVRVYSLNGEHFRDYLENNFQAELGKFSKVSDPLLVAIGRMDVNPFKVLEAYLTMLFGRDDSDFCDVQFDVPDRYGTFERFSDQFAEEVGIEIYQILEHKRGVDGELGRMVFRFNLNHLENAGVSREKLYKHLLRIDYKYPVQILRKSLCESDMAG